MDLRVHPRYDVRKMIADAVALASQIRAQLLGTAASLHRTAAEVEASLHVIRAQALGRLPAGLEAAMVPTADDVRDLRDLATEMGKLAEAASEVALIDPFQDPSVPTTNGG